MVRVVRLFDVDYFDRWLTAAMRAIFDRIIAAVDFADYLICYWYVLNWDIV